MKKKLLATLAMTIITTLSAMGCTDGNVSNPAGGEAVASENSISDNTVETTTGNSQIVSMDDKELQLSITLIRETG